MQLISLNLNVFFFSHCQVIALCIVVWFDVYLTLIAVNTALLLVPEIDLNVLVLGNCLDESILALESCFDILSFIPLAKLDRKLALLYLANDVVQNSRKKSKELILYFGKAFKETFLYLK